MAKFSKKVTGIIDEAKDLVEKILRWRQLQLDRILHVKYEPHKASSRSQFEAIMMDVNESEIKVEEYLKIQSLAEEISGQNLIGALDAVDLSYDEKALLEHKKKLKKEKEMQIHTINKKL
jgi:hypothetical protein